MNYPEFTANGIKYCYILTKKQAEENYASVIEYFQPILGGQLYLSHRLSISDLFTICGITWSYDYALPQDYFDANANTRHATVWLYKPISEGGSHFGEPFNVATELIPKIEQMVLEQFVAYVDGLLRKS